MVESPGTQDDQQSIQRNRIVAISEQTRLKIRQTRIEWSKKVPQDMHVTEVIFGLFSLWAPVFALHGEVSRTVITVSLLITILTLLAISPRTMCGILMALGGAILTPLADGGIGLAVLFVVVALMCLAIRLFFCVRGITQAAANEAAGEAIAGRLGR
jgi:hypothetical protein